MSSGEGEGVLGWEGRGGRTEVKRGEGSGGRGCKLIPRKHCKTDRREKQKNNERKNEH